MSEGTRSLATCTRRVDAPHVYVGNHGRCYYCNEAPTDRETVRRALKLALAHLDDVPDSDLLGHFVQQAAYVGDYIVGHAHSRGA